jgi:uncharacterized protein YbbK (DUF523 family)
MVLVSACLAGCKCRYDGNGKQIEEIMQMVIETKALPICPEVLGGMPIPRESCEINQGRVVTAVGNDYTSQFVLGAQKALEIAKILGVKKAILPTKSFLWLRQNI